MNSILRELRLINLYLRALAIAALREAEDRESRNPWPTADRASAELARLGSIIMQGENDNVR